MAALVSSLSISFFSHSKTISSQINISSQFTTLFGEQPCNMYSQKNKHLHKPLIYSADRALELKVTMIRSMNKSKEELSQHIQSFLCYRTSWEKVKPPLCYFHQHSHPLIKLNKSSKPSCPDVTGSKAQKSLISNIKSLSKV